jgi:hypothetical protein
MELQPDKRKQFHQALSKNFTVGELRQLSEFALNKHLEEITTSQNLPDIALELINWAESKDFLSEIIEGASQINPRNTILKELIGQISKPLQLQPEPTIPKQEQPEAPSPVEKPVEPQRDTVDINTQKNRRPHTERSQRRRRINLPERKRPQLVSPVSPEVDLPQKSPSSVLSLSLVCYQEIKQKQIQLLPIYLLFGVDTIEEIPPEQYEHVTKSQLFDIEDIWPEHCDFAVHLLQEIAQPVQDFYDLINDALTRERTTEVVQLQSSLMIPLRMSYEIRKNLISLIYEFKEVCQASPDDMLEQRREIMDNLKELRETLEQVNTTMDAYSQ